MKSEFTQALIKSLIIHKDFLPVKDSEGNLVLNRPVSLLTKDAYGTETILEILDGDYFTPEGIAARLQDNREMLSGLNGGKAYYYFEVVVFDSKPDPEKLEAIISGQLQNVKDKRYLKCISVNRTDGVVERHFSIPATDSGISRAIRNTLAKSEPGELDSIEIEELVRQKEQDYKIEMKVKVPVVTYTLIGVNILVAVLIYLYSMKSGISYSELLTYFGAKVVVNILAGEYWRFVTPIFLHANVMHLLVNCYSLYVIGVSVEKIYGRFRFLVVYFIAGIMGNLVSFMFSPNAGVGASGAIFGLLGAMLFFGLEKPALFRRYFGRSILLTIVINLTYGFSREGIDNFAHMGGLLGGFLASGMVAKSGYKRWYLNRFLYIALTVAILFSGLAYGFGNSRNRTLAGYYELVELDEAQDWAGAEAKAEEILERNPKDADLKISVLWTLTKAELNSSKLDEAAEHAKEVIELDPQNGHYLLGVIYYNMQQFDLSKEELLKAKEAGAAYEQIDEILSDIETMSGY